ncbi:MAG: hypothetical protein ACRERV_09165, partial [Methylococcales bacterium]
LNLTALPLPNGIVMRRSGRVKSPPDWYGCAAGCRNYWKMPRIAWLWRRGNCQKRGVHLCA